MPTLVRLAAFFRCVVAHHCCLGFLASSDVPRLGQKDLGAGALLDVGTHSSLFSLVLCLLGPIGIYVLSLASAILGPEAPSRIEALGELDSQGVDQQVGVILQYKKGMAVLHTAFNGDLPNEGCIVGSHGTIKIHKPMWCPLEITLSQSGKQPETFKFELPEVAGAKFNFTNSAGLHYEGTPCRHSSQPIDTHCQPYSQVPSRVYCPR